MPSPSYQLIELEELFNRHNKGTGVTSIPATFLRVTVAV
jgi:hypothetical protein